MIKTFLTKKILLIFLITFFPFMIYSIDFSATGYGKDPTSAKLSSIDELIEVIKKDFFNSDSEIYNNFDLKRVANGATFTSPNDTGSEDENLKYRIRATISDNYIRSAIIAQDEQRKVLNDDILNTKNVDNKENNLDHQQSKTDIQNTTNEEQIADDSLKNSSEDNKTVIENDTAQSKTNTDNTENSKNTVNTKFENFMNYQRENEVVLVSLGSPIVVEETKDLFLTWDLGFKFFKPFKRYPEYPYTVIDLVFGPAAGIGMIWSKGINFNLLVFPSFVKKTEFLLPGITENAGTRYFRTYGELYLAYRFTWGSMDTNIGLSFGTDFDYFSEFILQPKVVLSIPVPALHPVFDFVNVGIGGRYTFMSNDDTNSKAWSLSMEITLGGLF